MEHPTLTLFLRRVVLEDEGQDVRDKWSRAFVTVLTDFASVADPRDGRQRKALSYFFQASVRSALSEATRLAMNEHAASLMHVLSDLKSDERDLSAATDMMNHYADHVEQFGDTGSQSNAYHDLGRLAEERGDMQAAEIWYQRSLAIKEDRRDQLGDARTQHQLGTVALKKHNLPLAYRLFLQCLSTFKSLKDEIGVASSYTSALSYAELGGLSILEHDYLQAGRWMLKAHEVFRQLDPLLANHTIQDFLLAYKRANGTERNTLKVLWGKARLSDALLDD